MERKTQVHAEDGEQEIMITRDFDLPVELLFKAYEEPDLVVQWMGTKVLKLESKKHGSYQFETTDSKGKVVFRAHGVIHDFIPNRKITRTFEMENAAFGVQLELLVFKKITDETSKLRIHTIFESVAQRDRQLKLPFAQGLNMAHNRLQGIVNKLK
ncbi:MAG TPA: SRPBCC domain-containing protein [Balneolales bacterium]|nr:SRPBCC domain-containing protein [Balneolales bacterium]